MSERELTEVDGEWLVELTPDDIREFDGRLWQVRVDDPDFINLGIAPMPRTVWQAFVYHLCHGLIMRYPLWSVLKFSWRNRRSFIERGISDALDGDYAGNPYIQ